MSLRQAVSRTIIALLLAIFTFIYMGVFIPLDTVLDIRESFIVVGLIIASVVILAHAWISYFLHCWRHARSHDQQHADIPKEQ